MTSQAPGPTPALARLARRWLARLLPLGALACSGDQDELLAALDGHWVGSMSSEAGDLPIDATFEWRKDEELLFGLVSVGLPGLVEPEVYAVRRWNTVDDEAFLDLTGEDDATHGMDLDGAVAKDTYSGDASITQPCPEGTCGWAGKFSLEAAPATGTVPTTGSTGTY